VQASSSSPTHALLPANKRKPRRRTQIWWWKVSLTISLIAVDRVVTLGQTHRDCAAPLTQMTFPSFSSSSKRSGPDQISQPACFQIQTMIHPVQCARASHNNQADIFRPCFFLGCVGICQRHHFFYSQLLHILYPSVGRSASFATNPPKISQKSVSLFCITPF
jgi:hypothetical protein